MRAAISYDGGGCHIEWYRDDDNDSGYGDNAQVARWYGGREECQKLIESGFTPPNSWWVPAGVSERPPFEAGAHSCVGGDRF